MTGDNTGQIKIWDWQNSEIVYQEKLCEEKEKVAGLSFSRNFQNVLIGCLEKKIMYIGKK
jgi:WD40 repeat protein